MRIRLLTLLICISTVALFCGCGAREKLERKYDKRTFFGSWQAKTAIISNARNKGEQVEMQVPRYGWISCVINPDDTFTLEANINRDVAVGETEAWVTNKRIVVHRGYKMFTTGTFEYKDSVADFYNYNRQKHFRAVLYTLGGDFYLTCVDEKRNEWRLQFERGD